MSNYSQRFARLKKYFEEHRKLLILVLVGAFLLVGAHQSFAAEFSDVAEPAVELILSSTVGVLAMIVNILAWAVGQLVIAVLGMLVIPILGYNNFGNSAIIDIGWPLVRDVVNMFVIVVLLVIAVKTILNSKSANWEQQLPRLFIAVILVNFSRTLTLLIVDAGQVVMFTFVNALRDIAAGNFVSLFQINSMLSIGAIDTEKTYGLELFGFLGTAYANLMLLLVVLAVVVVLAIVFVYRIIMIWVLVILSPIAFFAKGLKDVLPGVSGKADEWWSKLVGVVTLGPILTFFLWLGLASATSGAIASTEGFNLEATEDNSQLYSEVFQVEELLSLLIGIILIMVGFQAASGAAGAMGGIAATLVNEQRGKSIALGAAKLPAALGYRATRAVGKRAMATETGRNITSNLSSGLQKLGTKVAATGVPGAAMVGGALTSGGIQTKKALTASQIEERRKARKELADLQPEEVAAKFMATRGAIPLTEAGVMQHEELYTKLTEDDDVADVVKKQMEAQYGKEEGGRRFDETMGKAFAFRESRKDTLDKDEEKKYKEAQEENLRYIGHGLPEAEREKKISKIIDKMNRENRLHKMTGDDAGDPLVQKILNKSEGTPFINMQTGEETRRTLMQQLLATKGLRGSARDNLKGKGVTLARRDANDKNKVVIDRDKNGNVVTDKQPTAERIETALKNPAISGLRINTLQVDELTANAENIAKGAVAAKVDWTGTDPAVAAAAMPHLQAIRDDNTNSIDERKSAAIAMFSASGDARAAFDVNPAGQVPPEYQPAFRDAIKNNPTLVTNIHTEVENSFNSGSPSDYTRAVSEAIDLSDIDDLLKKHNASTDQLEKNRIRTAIEDIKNAALTEGMRPANQRKVSDQHLNKIDQKASLAITEMNP